MNEIAKLVKNYNSFIEDLKQLQQDIHDIVETFNIQYQYEFWYGPRDRSFWNNKIRFACKYQSKKEVFYVGFDLDNDIPYLLLERMYELKNCKPDDFDCDTECFGHLLDDEIEKEKDENNIGSFECDWGKCLFARISLLEITSQDIVSTEIKSVIDHLFTKNKLSLKTIKLI